jgi:hypothetical protein
MPSLTRRTREDGEDAVGWWVRFALTATGRHVILVARCDCGVATA